MLRMLLKQSNPVRTPAAIVRRYARRHKALVCVIAQCSSQLTTKSNSGLLSYHCIGPCISLHQAWPSTLRNRQCSRLNSGARRSPITMQFSLTSSRRSRRDSARHLRCCIVATVTATDEAMLSRRDCNMICAPGRNFAVALSPGRSQTYPAVVVIG